MPSYPFEANTNKETQLIIWGQDSLDLPQGTELTILFEEGATGLVMTEVDGRLRGGNVLRTDYDRV